MSHNNNNFSTVVDQTPPRRSHRSIQQENNYTNNHNENNNPSIPLSPLSAAESFFTSTLLGVSPEHREKVALAASFSVKKKKHKRINSSVSSTTFQSITSLSTTSEDFNTALDVNEDLLSFSDNEDQGYDEEVNKINRKKSSLFPLKAPPITEETSDLRSDRNMPSPETTASTTSTTTVTTGTTPVLNVPTVETTEVSKSTVAEETPTQYDVAENIYEKAKSLWTWGKTIKSVTPFLDAAEDLATKVVKSATGLDDLDSVDKSIKPHLSGFDKNTLSPAIIKIMELIAPILEKGDKAMKPIATTVGGYVLGPFGLIKPPPSIEETPEKTLTQ